MKLFVISFLVILGCEHGQRAAHKSIPWSQSNPNSLADIEFLAVDDSVIKHSTEKRGFVSVPLDYNQTKGERLDVFYRLIPCRSCKRTHRSQPMTLVFINDGPGKSSASTQDYYSPSNEPDNLDNILKYFSVLMIDQRGTGYSSPLDLDNSDLKPELIANYFDADDIAQDHAQVIQKVLKGQKFYLMGQGFGGLILYSYLFINQAPRPKTFIFINSSIPPYNFMSKYRSRRRHQVALNKKMQTRYPQFKEKVLRLKAHLRKNDLNPNYVNALYTHLGDISQKNWRSTTDKTLNSLLKMGNSELKEYFLKYEKGPNILNYILSARSFTPKMTAQTIDTYFSKRMPMRPWMLNGFWDKAYLGELEKSWQGRLIQRIDKYPPPSTPFPSLRQLSDKFRWTSSLFIFGRDGKDSEIQFRRRELKWFKSPKVQVVEVPGSHGFIFEKGGAQLLKRLLDKQ